MRSMDSRMSNLEKSSAPPVNGAATGAQQQQQSQNQQPQHQQPQAQQQQSSSGNDRWGQASAAPDVGSSQRNTSGTFSGPADWRSNASATPFTASAGAAAAARLNFASGQAKSTVRRQSGPPSAPVSLKGHEIWLIPFNGWHLHMNNHDKPKGTDNKPLDLAVFLQTHSCIISSKGIRKVMSSAEVMEYIIDEFKKKNWDLTTHGFRYGKVVGNNHELLPAGLAPKDVDASKLQIEYGGSRCVIVRDTDQCKKVFQDYFVANDNPTPDQQQRHELAECNYCLLVMPSKYIEEHATECDRLGKPMVPRKPGFHGRVGGTKSLDYSDRFWKGDLAGIHHPDDLFQPEEQRARKLPEGVTEWNDACKWCYCQGLGRIHFGKRGEWVECVSKNQCPVRWYHKPCVEAALADDFEPDSDWECMLCKIIDQNQAAMRASERAQRRRLAR
ncbi:unnamed protein product [Tilletia controversa]|nr:unnamed protein product [Tilletia controversa]CAD6899177.1 unnamed protein product [Tilletia controversa]